jgi:hypothetical protein
VKRVGRAVAAGALWAALACQSIAGVEDVTFAGDEAGCQRYCATLKEACPGDVAVYEDDEICANVCKIFKAGTPSKPQGNTLACRAEQADIALSFNSDLSENRSNCEAAGPGGGEQCTIYPSTPNCEGYCTVYMAACTNTKDWGFNTFEQCTSRCAAFPYSGTYTAAEGAKGDSLACRLHHATLATVDPDNNCESAGVRPAGDCLGSGDPSCDDYCRVNEVACTGIYTVYESRQQCKAVCETLRKGDRTLDTGGQDTVGCRAYHSYFALMGAPTPHCSHSGPAGDGVCTDDPEHPNCIAFCGLLAEGCSEAYADVYGDDNDLCVAECEELDDANVAGGNLYNIDDAQTGNTLKCRTLHVARALTEPQSDETPGRCQAALGGDPCN